jgi:pyruvate/2-oxoglutarate dehydrogenase complex dihydrolipoamide dehydrogenase (E3) component
MRRCVHACVQDPYIVETLMDTLTHHGPKLHKQTSPARLFRAADGTITLVVTTATGMVEEHTGFDCVLSAIGRTPSTGDSLGLKLAGVEVRRAR